MKMSIAVMLVIFGSSSSHANQVQVANSMEIVEAQSENESQRSRDQQIEDLEKIQLEIEEIQTQIQSIRTTRSWVTAGGVTIAVSTLLGVGLLKVIDTLGGIAVKSTVIVFNSVANTNVVVPAPVKSLLSLPNILMATSAVSAAGTVTYFVLKADQIDELEAHLANLKRQAKDAQDLLILLSE